MNYCSIGRFVATFGVGGELILQHHLGKKSSLKGLETIFIEAAKDEMLPYFLQSTRVKTDDEIYVKLEDVDTKEAARPFVRKEIWLEESEFQKYAGKSAPISLLGFHIIDNGTDIGEILEVIE